MGLHQTRLRTPRTHGRGQAVSGSPCWELQLWVRFRLQTFPSAVGSRAGNALALLVFPNHTPLPLKNAALYKVWVPILDHRR